MLNSIIPYMYHTVAVNHRYVGQDDCEGRGAIQTLLAGCWWSGHGIRLTTHDTEILIDNLTWLILILSQHLIQLTG